MDINGKPISFHPVTYETIGRMALEGVRFDEEAQTDVTRHGMLILCALIALEKGWTLERASKEMRQHVNRGRSIDELVEAAGSAIDEFRKTDPRLKRGRVCR